METENSYKNIKLPVFFLDETGILKRAEDPYFALGVIKTERPDEIARAIRYARDKAHYYEEMKWNKMSLLKFDIGKKFIEAFIKEKTSHFSCIIINKTKMDFNKYFENDLYKVYRSFSVSLIRSNLNTEHSEICTVIADDYFYPEGFNLEVATRGIINDHYKKLTVAAFLQINSRSSDLLQLTDLLLGAAMYDLKVNEGSVKQHPNFKYKLLEYLHGVLGVKTSFFLDKKGNKQTRFFN